MVAPENLKYLCIKKKKPAGGGADGDADAQGPAGGATAGLSAGGLLGRMAWALVRTLLPAASPMANACEPGARVVLLLQPDLASLRDQERSLASDKGLRSHCST